MPKNPLHDKAKALLKEYGYTLEVVVEGWHVTCRNADGARMEIHAVRHWRIQVAAIRRQYRQNQRKRFK